MFNNIYNTTSKSIQQRLYLQTIIIAIFLFTMICISIWTENTLTMITAIARFERTHTVSRLEAKVSLLEYIDNRNDQAKESFYTNMAITQSYNKVFSNLLVMRKFKFENEFVKILETTFKEADHNTAVIIVNRIKVLYWHPIIKELVDYADKAHRAGEKIVKLAPLVMSANNEVQISSILREIERNEAEFVSNEHSFSKRCSDLSNEIANFVSYFSITILIFSVGFVSLITFLIAKSLLQQAVKHACDLEVSRRQYRNLVEGTPDLIIRIDVDGRFVFLNHAAKEIYGLSPEECIGRLSSDFIHPEDKEPTIDAFQAFLKSGKEILKYENRLVGIDGREHHMAWSIIAEKDENHIITGFASTGRDITEQKQAEEALIESEERFKMVLDGSQLGYWDWDIETNVVHRNERWAEMIGYTLKEIELNVKQWTDLHHPEDKDATWQSIQDHLENRTSAHNIEYRMRTKNGDYRWILDQAKIVKRNSKGKPLRMSGTHTDITEFKKLQSRLTQAHKIEAIGILAGGIAHDFNNMLSIIAGNISFAMNNLNKDDELYEVLSDVQKSSKQAQNLTYQLLTFSKGGAPIKKVADINKLINESSIFSIRGAKSKCNFDLSNDLWTTEIDEGQINQVIGNLVINANQAMADGGIITIKTENVEINTESGIPLSAGRYIKIVVEDKGVGISKKHLSNIFDPYFTTKQKGSGLGLATTYSIIKNHGGHISVYSEIEKGTVFNIYLPASTKDVGKIEGKEESKHTGQGKILIMDDQESILKMVTRMLERMGYQTTSATEGSQAIEIYKEVYQSENQFDLVILDLTVPGGMGGAKTIQELLKINPKIKAIVSSGYSNDPIMANYEDYGFCGVIPKPYSQDQIAKVLNKILGLV